MIFTYNKKNLEYVESWGSFTDTPNKKHQKNEKKWKKS